MNIINRSNCAITNSNDLEFLYSFKNFPVFMGCITSEEKEDILFDMDWVISKSSGAIQLQKLLPLDILYPESHGAGCVGKLWMEHHQALARFINTYKPTGVIEIGGAHGILSKNYQTYEYIDWTIIEPNPTPVEGTKAKFIKGFFDDTFVFENDYDTIVHSHVFEHIYEPDTFIKHLSTFMENGKNLIFSIPNMQIMLERKYTNCINFEHTIFLTEPYIEFLLAKYGYKLDKKEYFMDDHSIFYGCIKDSFIKPIKLNENMYEKNKKLYMDYIEYHQKLVTELNQRITKPVYLFGAHVFAQYLLSFGLNSEKIICLLDNDLNKQNKRLYGTNLKVAFPEILRNIEKPIVILKAGVYNNEIRNDILNNINPNVEFWE